MNMTNIAEGGNAVQNETTVPVTFAGALLRFHSKELKLSINTLKDQLCIDQKYIKAVEHFQYRLKKKATAIYIEGLNRENIIAPCSDLILPCSALSSTVV